MLGKGIGKTAALIQGRPMTTGALAVFPVGFEGDVGNTGRNLRDMRAAFEQEDVQGQNSVFTGSSEMNDPGLQQVVGTDLGGGRRFDQLTKQRLAVPLFMPAASAEVSMIIRPEDLIRRNR